MEDVNAKQDSAGIKVPPPLIYLGVFILGVILQWLIPIAKPPAAWRWWGVLFVAAGMAVAAAALKSFRQNKNSPIPDRPVTALVQTGIYKITRNPMYSGMMLAYLGMAWLLGIVWALILALALFWIINTRIISREEKYLTRRFGQAYLDYMQKVRRWL